MLVRLVLYVEFGKSWKQFALVKREAGFGPMPKRKLRNWHFEKQDAIIQTKIFIFHKGMKFRKPLAPTRRDVGFRPMSK